jgi:hypothetical protein
MSDASIAARKLIAVGAVGRVRTARIFSSTAGFGPTTDKANVHLEDPANGMQLPTIQVTHTIDLLEHVTGSPIADIDTRFATQFPAVATNGTAREIARRIPDQVLTNSKLKNGAVFTAEIVGGHPLDSTPYSTACHELTVTSASTSSSCAPSPTLGEAARVDSILQVASSSNGWHVAGLPGRRGGTFAGVTPHDPGVDDFAPNGPVWDAEAGRTER